MRSRAERSLQLALRNGIRAIRSHVDSFGVCVDPIWEALLHLRSKWKSLIELQLVALVPLDYWSSQSGKILANKVSYAKGLLGGVIVPPFNKSDLKNHLKETLNLANGLGCGVDFHIDESETHPASGLTQ